MAPRRKRASADGDPNFLAILLWIFSFMAAFFVCGITHMLNFVQWLELQAAPPLPPECPAERSAIMGTVTFMKVVTAAISVWTAVGFALLLRHILKVTPSHPAAPRDRGPSLPCALPRPRTPP